MAFREDRCKFLFFSLELLPIPLYSGQPQESSCVYGNVYEAMCEYVRVWIGVHVPMYSYG